MNYERTLLQLMERVATLEQEVKELKAQYGLEVNSNDNDVSMTSNEVLPYSSTSPKYRRLTDYLLQSEESEITLSFNEIENILGFNLSPSARKHRPNWSNTTTISLPRSWLAAGYKTYDVDMEKEKVTFVKIDRKGNRVF